MSDRRFTLPCRADSPEATFAYSLSMNRPKGREVLASASPLARWEERLA